MMLAAAANSGARNSPGAMGDRAIDLNFVMSNSVDEAVSRRN